MDVDWTGYLNNPAFAAAEIARNLNAGELALFVGAGISFQQGAPSWHALARMVSRKVGLDSRGINRKRIRGGDLSAVFTKAHRTSPANFAEIVKQSLYTRLKVKSGNWADSTLVALGSLMCGSSRGRIDTVLSLNFDSLLEMYLRLYGFLPQTITTYPCTLRRADVRIFHSHGFLPFDAEDGCDSAEILLTDQTYLEAIGEDNHPRKRMMEYVFAHKRVLAIGLSGDDLYSRATLAAMARKNPHGPLMGFWVIGPRESDDLVANLRDSKLAAVRLTSWKHLPEFLFSIARHAVRSASVA